MKLKYLLLALTVGVWLAAGAIAWPIRRYLTSDFVEYCCRLAAWTAQAQLAAMLIPLVGKCKARGVLVVALIVDINLQIYCFHHPPALVSNRFIQFAMYQAAVLLPLAFGSRFAGLHIAQSTAAAHTPTVGRQFSLLAMLVGTAVVAAYLLLIRNLDQEVLRQGFALGFFVVLPVCLALLNAWATLGQRGLLWRTAVLIAIVIVSANAAAAADRTQTFSPWEFAVVFASPALLVWLTCVTLRAFGWRLVWQKSRLPEAGAEDSPTYSGVRQ